MNRDQRIGNSASMSRRRFLQGLAALGAFAGLDRFGTLAWAAGAAEAPQALRGTEFNLDIAPTAVNMTGASRIATAVNGQVTAPILYWRQGDTVTLRVTNRLPAISSIHWHGILLPAGMDGVPGLSFNGIAPGETFVYRFEVKQSGTYWYHSHSRFQEQSGLYGPLIIEPRNGERVRSDREHVVMLSDWTDDDPEKLFAKLKKMSDFFNFNQPTAVDFMRDVSKIGLAGAIEKRGMWNRMRMRPTDFSDITGVARSGVSFTYLMNGRSPARN